MKFEAVPLAQRFWLKMIVLETGCWEWQGKRDAHGYGKTSIARKEFLAHRIAWILIYGDIPENLCVCHICDNPSCINPTHLFLGTHKDNITDATYKGRMHLGEDHGQSKLTEQLVLLARGIHQRHGISTRKLAQICEVSPPTMWEAINGKTWRHI